MSKPIFKKVGSSFELVKEDAAVESQDKKETVEKAQDCNCKISDLLQRQVDHEFANERSYLSMALWCEENGYPETAKFFSSHAVEEERVHGMKFINHMSKRRIKVNTPKPEESKREFENLGEVLKDAVEREKMTSGMIGELLKETIKEGDLAFSIANEFIAEQLEEEQLFESLLNLYKLCNGSKIDFEMEIGQLKASGKYKLGSI